MRKNFALAAVLCASATAMAQTIEFGTNHRQVGTSRHGLTAIEFDVNLGSIQPATDELLFRVPDRFSPLRLGRRSFEVREGRNGFWRGSVDQRADSDVMLTFHNGHVAGTVRVGNDLYEVRPTPDGHVVERIDTSTYPSCGGVLEAPVSEAGADASLASAARFASVSPAAPAAGATYTIDLLSVYTPQARAAAGGAAQIEAVIRAAIDAANVAFVNSAVGIVYRLVGTVEAAHNDAGDLTTDLTWLSGDAATASLRNQVGADLVSLVVENGAGYCGLGYVMRAPGSGFASAAFQVTARSCAVGNLTLAHEHGHNLGMEHDPANGVAPASASYPWSFGYLVDGVFRTVMSYATQCPNGCARLAYFSNPNVSYLGYPTGVANTNDNARTANLTAPIVAGFRSVTTGLPPAPPVGLTAVPVSASQVNLAWSDQSSDETGFRVERSQGGGSFAEVAVLGANVSSYTSNGLAASTQYAYRVRAYNSVGDSAYSNSATATTLALPTPNPPAGLSAVANSTTQINLFWTNASSDESGFRIERSSGGGSFSEIATTGAGATSYPNIGLTAGTSYSYRVRAFNAGGNSGYSNTATATTPSEPTPAPAAPASLSAAAANSSQVNLTWSDGSNNETGFKIERSSGGSAFTEIATAGAGVTSYSNTGLAAGTAYSYRVRAFNEGGNSAYSNTATATTQSSTGTPPPTPTGFAGSPSYSGFGSNRTLASIRLSWTDVVGETGYTIERCKATSLTSGCTYSGLVTLGGGTRSFSDRSISSAGRGIYNYRIRADNAAGSSGWAQVVVDAR